MWNANIYSTNIVSFIKILTIHSLGGVPDTGKALDRWVNCAANQKLMEKGNPVPSNVLTPQASRLCISVLHVTIWNNFTFSKDSGAFGLYP